jgi:hypothetical protein
VLREGCPGVDDRLLSGAVSVIVSVLVMAPVVFDLDSLAIGSLRAGSLEQALEESTRFAYGGTIELLGLGEA